MIQPQNMWDERYSNAEYIYGEEPNLFFASELNKMNPGTIILPCDGEGRNGVYAATKGWKVHSFDLSEAGKVKALQLANKKNAEIDYQVADATVMGYPDGSADVVAFIYAHFPSSIRKAIHQKAMRWLKPGGKIIIEAFNPMQLNNTSGGPKTSDMMYTEDLLRDDFSGLGIEILESLQVELNEGKYHEGISDIIRFVGIKK